MKRVKGQKKKAAVSLFSWVVCCKYNRLTVSWKWNVCFFPSCLVILLRSQKMQPSFRTDPVHISSSYHIQNVCLPSIPKKKNTKKEEKMLMLWFEVSGPKHRPTQTLVSGGTVVLRVVLLKLKKSYPGDAWWCHSGVLSLALCLYQRTVASNCRVQSQQPIVMWRPEASATMSSHWFVAHSHFRSGPADGSDFSNDTHTHTSSLTNNRASLLTILMFSTGFLVCSCNVLYTVANTSLFFSFR